MIQKYETKSPSRNLQTPTVCQFSTESKMIKYVHVFSRKCILTAGWQKKTNIRVWNKIQIRDVLNKCVVPTWTVYHNQEKNRHTFIWKEDLMQSVLFFNFTLHRILKMKCNKICCLFMTWCGTVIPYQVERLAPGS